MNAAVKIQASAGARHRNILFREYESTLNARIVDSRFLSVSVGSPQLQGERRTKMTLSAMFCFIWTSRLMLGNSHYYDVFVLGLWLLRVET